MASTDDKLTPTKALAGFVKLLPETARAMEPREGTRGAGYWLAFTKSRSSVIADKPERVR